MGKIKLQTHQHENTSHVVKSGKEENHLHEFGLEKLQTKFCKSENLTNLQLLKLFLDGPLLRSLTTQMDQVIGDEKLLII